jgi:O-methyltransferase
MFNAPALYAMWGKRILRSLIYRFPPIMIAPERLYLWMDTLIQTQRVPGDVLEVGCYLGGTAAVANKMLRNLSARKRYLVVDTFEGFVAEQWTEDQALGTPGRLKKHFSLNSTELARWVLDRHGGEEVEIIKGDIVALSEDSLPGQVSACLLDVDLSEPIQKGLERVYPRLQPGGVIIVDDCGDDEYKARIGYERFVRSAGLPEEYKFGAGIVRRHGA